MELRKTTVGFVTQTYDTETGKWLSQEFTCADQVDWENEDGNAVDPLDIFKCENEVPYLCFDMKDPSEIPTLTESA